MCDIFDRKMKLKLELHQFFYFLQNKPHSKLKYLRNDD